jgi:hypothetical protein
MSIMTNLASVFSLEDDYAEAEGYYCRYLKYLVYHPGQAEQTHDKMSTWLGRIFGKAKFLRRSCKILPQSLSMTQTAPEVYSAAASNFETR